MSWLNTLQKKTDYLTMATSHKICRNFVADFTHLVVTLLMQILLWFYCDFVALVSKEKNIRRITDRLVFTMHQ
jgi:hypothetical protein